MTGILKGGVRREVLTKWNATGQSIAMNGPAATISLYLVAIAGMVGYHMVLILIISFIIYAMMTYVVYQWSSKSDSTAPWMDYVQKGLGKGAGIAAGWIYWFYYVIGYAGFALLGLSSFLVYFQLFRNNEWLWVILVIVMSIEAMIISLKKIEISTRYFLYAGIFEIIFLLSTSIYLIIKFNFNLVYMFNFNFGRITYTSIILGIGAFGGISGLTPLTRETKNYKKEIPSALISSLFIIGGVIILGAMGQSAAMGPSMINNYSNIPDPGLFIYLHYIGFSFYVILLLLVINSFNSSLLATSNNFTRMLFGMSENSKIPSIIKTKINDNGVPYASLYIGIIIGSLIAIFTGIVLSPLIASIFLLIMAAIFSYVVHIMVSISLIFKNIKNSSFSPIKQFVIPLIVSIFLIVAIYSSVFLNSIYPYNYAIFISFLYILTIVIIYFLKTSKKIRKIADFILLKLLR
jgi:amino acid transporter